MRRLYLLILALAAAPAAARVYQWVDPDSRNVYLSGSPPAWYRSGTPGPRVLVFDDGKLVDDTGLETTEDQARSLREQALAEEQRLREEAAQQAASPPPAEDAAAPAGGEQMGSDARTKAEMQALVEQYLKSVLVEKLPLLLGGAAGNPPAAPPPADAGAGR